MENQEQKDKNLLVNEDILMSLQCAEKIKLHLDRLINKEAKLKYMNNRESLDFLIDSYERSLLKVAV